MSKHETVKVISPQGKVITLGAKAWRNARTLRDEGYAEYREPVKAATFPPVDEVANRGPGRPKKETNTESDADQA